MDHPPRSKKENIMTKDCHLWINMPHQCGICAMVIAVTAIAMWMHTGQVHQSDIVGLCEYMNDDSWDAYNGDDCVETISCPYYCMCHRWDGSQWDLLESGRKPYAIYSSSQWIKATREPITEKFYF